MVSAYEMRSGRCFEFRRGACGEEGCSEILELSTPCRRMPRRCSPEQAIELIAIGSEFHRKSRSLAHAEKQLVGRSEIG
jgi:hypothetical protein